MESIMPLLFKKTENNFDGPIISGGFPQNPVIADQPSEIDRLPGFFQMYGESFLRGVSLSAHSVRRNIPSIYCVMPEEL